MAVFVWYGGAPAAGTLSADISASIAAALTDDFAASASVTESIPAAVAAQTGDDFTAAASVTESIPATAAASFESDFSAAADCVSIEPVTATIAASLEATFSAGAVALVVSPVVATVAATIGSEFSVSAAVSAVNPSVYTRVSSRITVVEQAPVIPLRITRGDDTPITITFAQPVASLEEIWFTVREAYAEGESDNTGAVFAASLGDGDITPSGTYGAELELPHAETVGWLNDDYVYDVSARTVSDLILTAALGPLRVGPDVTRST